RGRARHSQSAAKRNELRALHLRKTQGNQATPSVKITYRPNGAGSVKAAAAALDGFRGTGRECRPRSVGAVQAHADHPIGIRGASSRLECLYYGTRFAWSGAHAGLAVDGDELHADRKSTRLNSSHVKISYAVFCLKK